MADRETVERRPDCMDFHGVALPRIFVDQPLLLMGQGALRGKPFDRFADRPAAQFEPRGEFPLLQVLLAKIRCFTSNIRSFLNYPRVSWQLMPESGRLRLISTRCWSEVARRLAERADVVVENFRPDVAIYLGID